MRQFGISRRSPSGSLDSSQRRGTYSICVRRRYGRKPALPPSAPHSMGACPVIAGKGFLINAVAGH
jgi:hypothetical protein